MRQLFNKKMRYSIRKFSVGVASVAVGAVLAFGAPQQAEATTYIPNPSETTEFAEQELLDGEEVENGDYAEEVAVGVDNVNYETTDIEYDTTYNADDTLPFEEQAVKVAGENGSETVETTYDVHEAYGSLSNPVETGRSVVDPVTEQIGVGNVEEVREVTEAHDTVYEAAPEQDFLEHDVKVEGKDAAKVTERTYDVDEATGELSHPEVTAEREEAAVTEEIGVGNVHTHDREVAHDTKYSADADLDFKAQAVREAGENGVVRDTTTFEVDRDEGFLKNPVQDLNQVIKDAKTELVAVGNADKVVIEDPYETTYIENDGLTFREVNELRAGKDGYETVTRYYQVDEDTGEFVKDANGEFITNDIDHTNEDDVLEIDRVVEIGTIERVKEIIEFDTLELNSNDLEAGETKVLQAGRNGEVQVVYDYAVNQNGELVDPVEMSRDTLVQVVNAIILVGTGVVSQPEDPADVLPEPSLDFRVDPYLQAPSSTGMTINWVSEFDEAGQITIKTQDGSIVDVKASVPVYMERSEYTEAEIEQEITFDSGNGIVQELPKGSWLLSNENYLHSVTFEGLQSNTVYDYFVNQGDSTFHASFKTFPTSDEWDHIRLIAYSDTETEPKGRLENREWELHTGNPYAEGSEERPELGSDYHGKFGHAHRNGEDLVRYPLDQATALNENLAHIQEADPDALIIAGDLTQGSGYQPAWDEFFRHFAGEFTNTASYTPLLTALGNWETYGAVNGGYSNAALSRNKYHDYMTTPGDSENPQYKDSYYRTDIGPITLLTLDSTKGIPHETTSDPYGESYSGDDSMLNENVWATEGKAGDPYITTDTQGSFTWEEYRQKYTELFEGATEADIDLPGFNPGTEQWDWVEEQLKDARNAGQIILVQFHHAPYSSGVHGTAPNFEHPDNQSGVAMRVYTPLFEQYGVSAVIAGHDEMFERSWVDENGNGLGFQVFDVGVAADGLRSEKSIQDEEGNYVPLGYNTHTQWSATADAPELWDTNENGVKHLIDGGLHYGHLQMDLVNTAYGSKLIFTPVYIFPILDDNYELVRTERRVYDDVTVIHFDENGNQLREAPTPTTEEN